MAEVDERELAVVAVGREVFECVEELAEETVGFVLVLAAAWKRRAAGLDLTQSREGPLSTSSPWAR